MYTNEQHSSENALFLSRIFSNAEHRSDKHECIAMMSYGRVYKIVNFIDPILGDSMAYKDQTYSNDEQGRFCQNCSLWFSCDR